MGRWFFFLSNVPFGRALTRCCTRFVTPIREVVEEEKCERSNLSRSRFPLRFLFGSKTATTTTTMDERVMCCCCCCVALNVGQKKWNFRESSFGNYNNNNCLLSSSFLWCVFSWHFSAHSQHQQRQFIDLGEREREREAGKAMHGNFTHHNQWQER